jgi:ADP-ribose pyrophosphatase YjhB (NUDIX family)
MLAVVVARYLFVGFERMNTLTLARELEAIAQTGLHFTEDPYDRERYERLRKIAAELLADSSHVSADDVYEWSKAEFGYATPKVDVRAFILSEGKVLLIREDVDDGRWTLPGGWADVNESPSEAVIREVEEESGYVVEPRCLLAVLDREKQGHVPPFPYHVYKMFFHCEITGGSPRPNLESSESDFFTIGSLPELSESRVLASQLRVFYKAVQSGNSVASYD